MSNIYVKSTTGNNVNNGSSWALAKLNLSSGLAISSPGDNIYVSQSHNEINKEIKCQAKKSMVIP